MWSLVARDQEGNEIGRVALAGGEIRIGRDPECALVLASATVSRMHARLYLAGGRPTLEDLKSARGTRLDGQPVTSPAPLSPDCRIQIGEFVLTLEPTAPPARPPTRRPAIAPPPVSATPPAPAITVRVRRPAAPAAAAVRATVVPGRQETVARAGAMLPPASGLAGSDLPALTAPGVTATGLAAVSSAAGGIPWVRQLPAAAGLRLVGRGGPYADRVFDVDRDEITVGRVESDITLEEPSISRRHARLRRVDEGARLEVFDLRSQNGTYLNGQRIKLSRCGPGDRLRFGELVFRVEEAGAGRAVEVETRRKRSRVRRAWLAAAVGLAVLAAAAGIAVLKRPPPPSGPTQREVLARMAVRVQGSIDRGNAHLRRQKWALAENEFNQALELDPLNDEARRLLAQVQREAKNEQVYRQGLEAFEIGSRDAFLRARDLFEKVPADSSYRSQVKSRLPVIDRQLAAGFRSEGITRCNARQWKDCYQALCRFFEHSPEGEPIKGQAELRKAMTFAEVRARRSRDFVPCAGKRATPLSAPVAEGGAEIEALLAESYPERPLREVAALYARGKIEEAMRSARRLLADSGVAAQGERARELERLLLVARGKFEEGYSALRERRLAEADHDWQTVLETDTQLVGPKLESYYHLEISRQLGDAYEELGNEELGRFRYREAYASFGKGKRVAPRHDGLLNGLLRLEDIGRDALKEGEALLAGERPNAARAKIELARDITEPQSVTHQEAVRLLEGMK